MTTILHICDWYVPIGGAEKVFFDTLTLLEEAGHTNIVVYNDHSDQAPTGLRPEYACKGLEYFVYSDPKIYPRIPTTNRKIERIIRHHRPDICHIQNLQNPFVIRYLIDRLPCVRTIHDPRLYCFTQWQILPDNTVCHFPLGQACLKENCLSPGLIPRTLLDKNGYWVLANLKVHKKMPILLAVSRSAIRSLLQNGFRNDQIVWLPNFTPVRPEAEVRALIANHYSPDNRNVLFIGRASYEKGAHVLLDACKFLKSDCRVVLITGGPLLDQIRSEASKYGDRVQVVTGLFYEQTREYYARSHAVVVPSVWLETFGLTGIEAYAHMKPVIGSRIGGITDWLRDNETGWFFEPGNAQELAKKIDEAVANPHRTEEMGYAGYQRVRSYYNSDLYLSRLTKAYQKAVDIFEKRHSG